MSDHFRTPVRAELVRRIEENLSFYKLSLKGSIRENFDDVNIMSLLDFAIFPTDPDQTSEQYENSRNRYISIFLEKDIEAVKL